MLNKQINPNKIYTLTDGLLTARSVRKSIRASNVITNGFVRRYLPKDLSVDNYRWIDPSVMAMLGQIYFLTNLVIGDYR